MSDVYTTVTNRSLGDNLIESIKGFLIGIVMFIAAFPILWMNEGCTDMSTVAKTAVVVKADNPGSAGEGKLVAVTADLKSDETIGDPDMLAPGSYVMLRRKVEMFAWNEKKESHTEKKLGGGSKTVTTYKYDLVWSEDPQRSSGFADPDGHENPDPSVQKQTFYATHARVGAFSFSPHDCQLPPSSPVALSSSMVKVSAPATRPAATAPVPDPASNKAPPGKGKTKGKATAAAPPPPVPQAPEVPSANAFRFAGGYLYKGRGVPEKPSLGDVRVSYEAVTPGALVTLYGKRQGTDVVAFVNDKDDKLFRAVPGTHEQAMAQLHTEAVMMRWIGRIGGFICMWLGLALFLAPFNAVLDIVPFMGSAGRFVTGLVMFPVALILSVITMLISIVAHNPILLVLIFLVVVGGLVALLMTRKKKAPAMQPQPAGMPPMGYHGPPMGGHGGPPQGGGYGGPPQGGYGPPPGGGYGGPPQGGYGPPPGGGYGGPPIGGA